ncbi:MAG: BMP family ABC transporter substrate-binding protein [Clostridia bacterium]|nr:BMP family ABC transporter substrate-binding protein [Clostridia bacterium]
MKKIVSVLLALAMLLCATAFADGIAPEDIKMGLICIGDENSGYDVNFIDAARKALDSLGLSEDQLIIKYNSGDGELAYDAAVDLAENGCNYIFADSFGHEDYVIQVAAEYPEIQFSHATGFKAASSGLANMHNAFASIYEGRYVAGVVAGMKLNEMIANGDITEDQAKVGYVGAFPFAEVISGYTSFFLGVRSVCPSATMAVQYINNWGDFALEKEAAEALIGTYNCVLISQHADTTGAPTACEAAGVPCVGYNISMISTAPTCALVSSRIDWSAYIAYAIQSIIDGNNFDTDWCQGFADGAVALTELNEAAIAEGTEAAVADIEAKLIAGELEVFDTSTFTIGGLTPEEFAETEDGAAYAEYIHDGAFHESEASSAPYFNLIIDGIEELAS